MHARALLPVALVALLVAGCTQTPATPPALQAPQGPVTVGGAGAIVAIAGENGTAHAVLASATAFLTGFTSGEPTIGVSKEGRLFVTAVTFQGSVPGQPRTDILRSEDGGRNWTDISPMLGGQKSHPITGDPMLYMDSDTGRLFDIDQIEVGCDYVSSTDDNGATWTPPTAGCPFPPSDHQTIATALPSTLPASPLYAKHVFACINQISDTECERSVDGGMTFQATTPPFRGIDEKQAVNANGDFICSGLVGHLKTSAKGVLFLPKDHCRSPLVAVSADEGVTWTVTQVAKTPVADDPTMAVDASGVAYYAWVAEDGSLLLSTSKDQGVTWSPPVDVRAPGLTATNLPALAAGGDGRLALAYYGTSAKGGYKAINAQDANVDNVTWDGYLAEITNATSPTPTVLTARINPQNDPLVRGTCGPGRCRGVFDFIDVQVDHEGRPWAAFVDTCTVESKCLASGAKADTSSDARGMVASLAVGPDLLTGAPLGPIHGLKP
ncbi:MAG: sialidase family protein [Thermoplasmatota archaeon]